MAALVAGSQNTEGNGKGIEERTRSIIFTVLSIALSPRRGCKIIEPIIFLDMVTAVDCRQSGERERERVEKKGTQRGRETALWMCYLQRAFEAKGQTNGLNRPNQAKPNKKWMGCAKWHQDAERWRGEIKFEDYAWCCCPLFVQICAALPVTDCYVIGRKFDNIWQHAEESIPASNTIKQCLDKLLD
jgi:predicted transposase YbfD/YdcC